MVAYYDKENLIKYYCKVYCIRYMFPKRLYFPNNDLFQNKVYIINLTLRIYSEIWWIGRNMSLSPVCLVS